MTVERMGECHISGVAQIERTCFGEPWSEESLRLLLGNGGVAFVAVDNGRVVAYGGMLTVLDEGQITNIAVLPEYRRIGYGRAVVSALIEYGRNNGISTVSLEVRSSNLAAKTLYESMGWKECGVRKNFYRFPTEDAIVMVLNRL